MNGLPAGFRSLIDTPQCAQGGDRQSRLQMLDGSDGPARLVFTCGLSWRHVARLDRWLAIVRPQPTAGTGFRMIWLLDASTVRWSGGMAPGELYRGVTGLASEVAPILWFRAGSGDDRRRGFTASGVFGAAGIVDAAQVRVATRRIRRQARLRMSIDTGMWGLSTGLAARNDTAPAGYLAITASGVLRPLELQVIGQWL